MWTPRTLSAPKTPTRKDMGSYKKPAPPKTGTPSPPQGSFDRTDRTRKHDTRPSPTRKTSATKATHGSTYDFRKGSQAKKPSKLTKRTPTQKGKKTFQQDRLAKKARDKKIRLAARKQRAAARANRRRR
jgi:hypothetical protein